MKIWAKISIKDKNKEIEEITKSLTNYLYLYGPIVELEKKYNIKNEDLKNLHEYTANRIAGILLLYLSKDYKRINDIVNKYNVHTNKIGNILPEIEGYIEKQS